MYWYRLLVLHGPHIVTKFIELCCLGYRTNWTETYTCTYIVLKWLIDHIISQINCTSISATTVLSTGFYAQPEAVTFSIQPPTNVVTCAGCGEVVLTCGISLQRATTNLPVPELRWTFNGAMVRE